MEDLVWLTHKAVYSNKLFAQDGLRLSYTVLMEIICSKVCVSGCSVGCGRAGRVRRSLADRSFTSQNPPREIRGVCDCGFGERC